MDQHNDDAAMEAECRLLGTLLLTNGRMAAAIPVTEEAMQCPFHGAALAVIRALHWVGRDVNPGTVWDLMQHHPEAETFGLQHLVDLATKAARPETLLWDALVVHDRRIRELGAVVGPEMAEATIDMMHAVSALPETKH